MSHFMPFRQFFFDCPAADLSSCHKNDTAWLEEQVNKPDYHALSIGKAHPGTRNPPATLAQPGHGLRLIHWRTSGEGHAK